jgi:hypothetical protein
MIRKRRWPVDGGMSWQRDVGSGTQLLIVPGVI